MNEKPNKYKTDFYKKKTYSQNICKFLNSWDDNLHFQLANEAKWKPDRREVEKHDSPIRRLLRDSEGLGVYLIVNYRCPDKGLIEKFVYPFYRKNRTMRLIFKSAEKPPTLDDIHKQQRYITYLSCWGGNEPGYFTHCTIFPHSIIPDHAIIMPNPDDKSRNRGRVTIKVDEVMKVIQQSNDWRFTGIYPVKVTDAFVPRLSARQALLTILFKVDI